MPEPFSRIYFRADGDTQTGLGHLYRCLNLARTLRSNFACEFLMERAPVSFCSLLADEGIDFSLAKALPASVGQQVVVLDSYEVNAPIMQRWGRGNNLVVVIDDWARDFFDCDVVISYGPEHRADSYRGRPGCRLLVGVEYALLHPAFFTQPVHSRDQVRRVLLAFGGADAANATCFALKALDGFACEIDVVLGAAYPHKQTLAPWRSRPGITFYQNLEQPQLASVMSRADAAIVAGGGMSLELCAVGVPCLLIAVADNQIRSCEALAERGMAAYAGELEKLDVSGLRACASKFFGATDSRREMIRRMQTLFTTSGASRVSQVLCELAAGERQ